jgi:hypothetical protein
MGLSLAGAVVLGCAAYYLWRKRRGSESMRVLRAISVAALHDVLLPDGMGGHLHFAHLLLTVRGLVAIEVKSFRGAVFGSDRMDEWTVIGARRFTFPNPQSALLDRVAILRQLVRDVPVEGYIMFGAGADFSKGRPKHIVFAHELLTMYRKPERAELERVIEAFAPEWERVKEAVLTAT